MLITPTFYSVYIFLWIIERDIKIFCHFLFIYFSLDFVIMGIKSWALSRLN